MSARDDSKPSKCLKLIRIKERFDVISHSKQHQDRMAYYYDEVEYSQPTIRLAAPRSAAGIQYDAFLATRPAIADLVSGLRLVRSSVRYENDPEADAVSAADYRVPALKVKYYRRVRRPSLENVAVVEAPAAPAAATVEQSFQYVRRAPQLVSNGMAIVDSPSTYPTRILTSRARSQGRPVAVRDINLEYHDMRDVVRENNNFNRLDKTIVTNVNRHHYHTLRVIDNTNNYNSHVTNHIIKVNDIHHQRTENVQGETREFNDVKETQTVEQPRCINAASSD